MKVIYETNERRMEDIIEKSSAGITCTSFGGTGTEQDPLFATFEADVDH